MRYYPIFLDLRGRRTVVVGGGRVAERKVQSLLRAGASVHVISPAVTPRLAFLAAQRRVDLTPRAYHKGDLLQGGLLGLSRPKVRSGIRPLLVFAATNDPVTQRAVRQEAEAIGALVNSADGQEHSTFLVPASFAQGDLQVAISTSGASPALAGTLRQRLQASLGPEYRAYLRLLRAARKLLMKSIPNQEDRARALRRLTLRLVDLHPQAGTRKAGSQLRKVLRKVGVGK